MHDPGRVDLERPLQLVDEALRFELIAGSETAA